MWTTYANTKFEDGQIYLAVDLKHGRLNAIEYDSSLPFSPVFSTNGKKSGIDAEWVYTPFPTGATEANQPQSPNPDIIAQLKKLHKKQDKEFKKIIGRRKEIKALRNEKEDLELALEELGELLDAVDSARKMENEKSEKQIQSLNSEILRLRKPSSDESEPKSKAATWVNEVLGLSFIQAEIKAIKEENTKLKTELEDALTYKKAWIESQNKERPKT
jgi:hypothetical protein